MANQERTSPKRHARFYYLGAVLFLLSFSAVLRAQEGFHTETSSGVNNIRIAVADFKPGSTDPQIDALKRTFDTTLFSDLANAGIFDIVSKSLLPESVPGSPAEINVQQWAAAPTSAAMVAFGSFNAQGGQDHLQRFPLRRQESAIPAGAR